jgi:hypothetical protein
LIAFAGLGFADVINWRLANVMKRGRVAEVKS